MKLKDSNFIVTGGANGLGQAIVTELVGSGAQVAAFDIDTAALEALGVELPSAHAVECDVASSESIERALNGLGPEFEKIHGLVNNAGVVLNAPLVRFGQDGLEMHSEADWNRVLKTNLSSVFCVSRQVAARMVKKRVRGVIVNISSISARGNAGQSAYSASKAGINALTATWAKELGRLGIRVVAVAPGYVDVASTRRAVPKSVLDEIVKRIPLRRLADATEVVRTVLAAIENDYVTGKVLEVDGGLVL